MIFPSPYCFELNYFFQKKSRSNLFNFVLYTTSLFTIKSLCPSNQINFYKHSCNVYIKSLCYLSSNLDDSRLSKDMYYSHSWQKLQWNTRENDSFWHSWIMQQCPFTFQFFLQLRKKAQLSTCKCYSEDVFWKHGRRPSEAVRGREKAGRAVQRPQRLWKAVSRTLHTGPDFQITSKYSGFDLMYHKLRVDFKTK